jgi:hypothetical protein
MAHPNGYTIEFFVPDDSMTLYRLISGENPDPGHFTSHQAQEKWRLWIPG